jgi:hypothetical protein
VARATAGSEWYGQIDDHLNSPRVILLLISADLVALDYVEPRRAMERVPGEQGKQHTARRDVNEAAMGLPSPEESFCSITVMVACDGSPLHGMQFP